jgi:hypothetical protein
MKKQVSGNTVFERVALSAQGISSNSKRSIQENNRREESIRTVQSSKQSLESPSALPNSRPTPSAEPSTIKPPGVPLSAAKNLSHSTTNTTSALSAKEIKDKTKKISQSGGRRRKVLAIDGFFKEVQKRVTRYICDVCGRAMASKFAFVRHLREHDWSDEEEENEKEKLLKEESSKRSEFEREVVSKSSTGYCKPCKLVVTNFVRHKMYHEIRKLEKTHPNVKSLDVM